MTRKRKKKERALRDAPSHKPEEDDTGLQRFLTMAFRRAVRSTPAGISGLAYRQKYPAGTAFNLSRPLPTDFIISVAANNGKVLRAVNSR